jgi:hypothetical protein
MHNLRYLAPIIVTIWTLFLISNTVFAQNSFRADLVGEAETPPLFSESYGTALISGNDNSLMYKINVTSLDKVTGVYLYRGDSSENGQVLVALLNSTKPTGVIKGTLAQGTINESSILVPLANLTIAPANNMTSNMTSVGNMTSNMTSTLPAPVPASKLASLIELMNQNMTYINIHTSKFPDGELRGTLSNSTN